MNDSDLKQLASSWTRLVHLKGKTIDEEFWSAEALWDHCRKNPELAWRVIVEIYSSHPGELVLANLAAGPLEDLLVYHGETVLPWIRQYCANDAGFIEVVSGVWKNAMSDEVWNGLRKLIPRGYSG